MFANDSQEEDAMIRQVGKHLKCISFHLYPMVLNLCVSFIYLSQIKCKLLFFFFVGFKSITVWREDSRGILCLLGILHFTLNCVIYFN